MAINTTTAISRTPRAISTVPRPISDWAAAGGVAGATVEPTDGGGVTSELSEVLAVVLLGVSELDVVWTEVGALEPADVDAVDAADELELAAVEELSVVWSGDESVTLD